MASALLAFDVKNLQPFIPEDVPQKGWAFLDVGFRVFEVSR